MKHAKRHNSMIQEAGKSTVSTFIIFENVGGKISHLQKFTYYADNAGI